jgi:hypothetical protein
MPKTPRDFSKGLIYSIVCKTDETLIYVGSTTNFRQRKNKHKADCQNENNRDHNTPVYVMIRANGGWTNFDMIPVKEYACENVIQLTIEEERIRKEIQATLNTRRAFQSEEELKEHTKNYRKEHAAERKKYNQEHKTEAKEYYTKYAQDNRAKIKEKLRKYRQEHKAEIKERQRQYYQEHQAEAKKYNQEHKDERNKKARERYLAKKLSAPIE